jgi:hypothetical protein
LDAPLDLFRHHDLGCLWHFKYRTINVAHARRLMNYEL